MEFLDTNFDPSVQVETPSKVYLEYGYLKTKPFYRETWFVVALAAASIVIIIMVVAILCVKSKTYKYKGERLFPLIEGFIWRIHMIPQSPARPSERFFWSACHAMPCRCPPSKCVVM